jgi:hypothetical protein
MSVGELKSLKNLRKPVSITAKPVIRTGTPIAVPNTNYYKTGDGVVLRPVAPYHSQTASKLSLHNVWWDADVLKKVLTGNANVSIPIDFWNRQTTEQWEFAAIAEFYGLPKGKKTYLLTIVTDIPQNLFRLVMNTEVISSDLIVQSPGIYRFIFTSDLETLYFMYGVKMPPAVWTATYSAGYIQLADLD